MWGATPAPSTRKDGNDRAKPPSPPRPPQWKPVGLLSVMDDGAGGLHFRVACAGPPEERIALALGKDHSIAIALMKRE